MTQLLVEVPVDFICLGVPGALGLRKLVRMERSHWPRVVILTLLLRVPTVYLVLRCCPPTTYRCVSFPVEGSDAFTITEQRLGPRSRARRVSL